MTRVVFSVEAVRRALADPAVASVQVIETFPASTAEVARLAVRYSDNRPPAVVIGKHATGDGVAAPAASGGSTSSSRRGGLTRHRGSSARPRRRITSCS